MLNNDDPITVFGFVVDQALVSKLIAMMMSGVASSLASLVPKTE